MKREKPISQNNLYISQGLLKLFCVTKNTPKPTTKQPTPHKSNKNPHQKTPATRLKKTPPYLEFTPLGINICFQSGSSGAQIQHEVVYHKPEDISALPVTHTLPKDWGDAVATAGSAKLQLNLGLVFKSRTSHQSSKIPKSFYEVEVGVLESPTKRT